uniref:glycerol-3-phosphate dehydrogenase n=1 Tax=Corethron hystrix TaxID=216773 RepID=A0A7S1FPT7_9STRA
MAAGATATVGGCVLIFNSQNRRPVTENAPVEKKAVSFPAPQPLPSRTEQIERLRAGKTFDVLVIGGGATGCGAVLDAQMRGLDAALIERGDFSSETSGRSTKLIWAGIRYIATAIAQLMRFRNIIRPFDAISDFRSEFKMVLGAHRERRLLLENNPHLTNWVPIAVPMKTWGIWPPPFGHPLFSVAPLTLPGVFKFYDSLSGFSCPPSHIMSKSRAARKFPQLDEDVKYVSVFYEGQHNDARTATCIALTAAEEGAAVGNYVEMIDIIRENGDSGKAVGIVARDHITGDDFEIRAKSIIFAGGPFTDGLRRIEDPKAAPAVNGAAGTHIVMPGYYAPDGIGLLDINTSDGRFLFFLPWQGSVIVGTTDRKGPPESTPGPPEDEIRWLLNETEKYLSNDIKVRRGDVLSAWQGFRPLASDPNAKPGAPISRDHIISTNPDTNITFITGGKWTTYREMAEDVIDRVIKLNNLGDKAGPCRTHERPLRGGVGYERNIPIQLVQDFGVSEETAEHLAKTYGANAFDVCRMAKPTQKRWPRFGNVLVEGYPYLECEIEWACKNEMVITVKDMLTLRTRLAFINSEAAKSVAPRVAEIMGNTLGWSKQEKKSQLAEAQQYLSEFGGPVPNTTCVRKLTTVTKNDIRDLFKTLDNDGNGYIDLVEMIQVSETLGIKMTRDEAKEIFDKMDHDKNGKVSEEDFIDWWNSVGPDNELRKSLDKKFQASAEKLGTGSESRGVMFG